MVRGAAAGLAARSMLPWVAPEVLRTPELVTGKVCAWGMWVEGWASWCMMRVAVSSLQRLHRAPVRP